MIEELKFIEIEIFSYCNRKCWFCRNSFVDRLSHNHLMPEEKYLNILQQLKDINFSGEVAYSRYNEPTAFRDIFIKRIKQAREYLPNAKLRTNTNGDYMTKDYIEELESIGFNELFIQQYLSNNEVYNHKKVTKKMLKKIKKLDIPAELIVDVDDHKIEYDLSYKNMTVHIRARNFAFDGSSRGDVVPIAMDYTRTERCLKPFDSMYVDYNGSVMICCNLRSDVEGHDIGYMGNAFDEKLDNIFSGDKYKPWRDHHLTDGPKEGVCKTCKIGICETVEEYEKEYGD